MTSRVSTGSICALAGVLMAGCLGPQASDDLGGARLVQPADAVILDAEEVPSIRAQIADNDGVNGEIPLLNGFANRAETRFWNFGEVSEFAAPLFRLGHSEGDSFVFEPHFPIIDVIPGQSGYSPYWAVFFVEVTENYNNELITSFAAIDEAQRLGLIRAPKLKEITINCPIVGRGVTLEVETGSVLSPTPIYWQGQIVYNFDLGTVATDDDTSVIEESMYVLRREGEELLSEPERGVDMTGDADINDTNNVFSAVRENPEYSPLVRVTVVTLDEAYSGIDTTQDVSMIDATSSLQLFSPDPSPAVVAFETDEILRNMPQQKNVGGL